MRHITTFRVYLLGLALLFAAYVLVESHRPKPLDWTPTYINTDKIPYGTYALFDQLPHLLGTDSIEVTRLPVYNQLTSISLDDSPQPDQELPTRTKEVIQQVNDSTAVDSATIFSQATVDTATAELTDEEEYGDDADDTAALPMREVRANYLFVNNEFGRIRLDERTLLAFARQGNAVFITAEDLHGAFLDSLNVQVAHLTLPMHKGTHGLPVPDSVTLRFANPALAAVRCRLPGSVASYRFTLGPGRRGHTLATDEKGRAVYVEIPHGRGHFYLCAVPAAFSNFYFLRPRTRPFAVAALRYLPARRTFWDEYQKQGAVGEQSLLRVLVAHDALRTAYFLTLAAAVIFTFMGARRRQRIIPTINPLPNTTLLFTRTVAGLYRQGRNHGLIAEKKVSLFMDYLRTRFQETSPDFGDEAFRERLSQKAGMPRTRVDELLRMVNFARTAPQMNDHELMLLSQALSDFKREAR